MDCVSNDIAANTCSISLAGEIGLLVKIIQFLRSSEDGYVCQIQVLCHR